MQLLFHVFVVKKHLASYKIQPVNLDHKNINKLNWNIKCSFNIQKFFLCHLKPYPNPNPL